MKPLGGLGLIGIGMLIGAIGTKNYNEINTINSDEVNSTRLQISVEVVGNLEKSYNINYLSKGKSYKLDDFRIKGPFLVIPSKKKLNQCLTENKKELDKANLDSIFVFENQKIKSRVSECLGYN